MRIYSAGFPYETTAQEVEELFSLHGDVKKVIPLLDKVSGRNTGVYFIEMAREAGMKAIGALDGATVGWRTISVAEARKKPRPAGVLGEQLARELGR